MSQVNRLPAGGRVDRSQPLTFTFNGKSYQGFPGDTIASALLANGVDVVARSFKYSRPRGIVTADTSEPNAILQVGSTEATTIPNLRATETELYDGLICDSTSGWPNVDFDAMSFVGKVGGRAMPPGFYYKTFMFPQNGWLTYEKYIRKGAGLGRSPREPDPSRYDKINRHCDVMVVGGGPAGLAAALAAGRRGARVILADEQAELGGHLLASRQHIDGSTAPAWVEQAVAELEAMPEVTILRRSTVFGYHDHNFLTVLERCTDHLGEYAEGVRQRSHRVRAGRVVLATGAQERPLVYANNDLPGCMTTSAVSTYVNRYAVAPGQRLVVMTTNDHGYRAAIDWHDAGREVVAVVDTRPQANGPLPREARTRGIKVITGHAVIEAQGGKRVSSALVAPIDATGERVTGSTQSFACD
ncbi:MAG: 2Fe-2S iron-sulfur cluster-binding protein, partial [Ectothiorhodospiraceae bacterium]